MLIQGSARSRKTQILVENYVKLIDSGISASQILVLCQNAYKRSSFFETVKEKTHSDFFENPKIYTFFGLAYNAVSDNWADIENTITIGSSSIFPHLTGLEISELLMKQAINEVGFADYNSKVNLLHQLFRRFSLITQNNLSQQDVKKRSIILNETFADDTKKTLEIFKKKTLEYRAFDYLRQLNIFSYIYKNTDYFKDIKYIFLDDADEITTAEFEFIKALKPQLKEAFIAYDRRGASRYGFLNADINTVEKIENLLKEKPIELDNIEFFHLETEHISKSGRIEMINSALDYVRQLLDSGVQNKDISIVTPVLDSSLKFLLKERFSQTQYISGSEKLIETPLVQNVLTILKLCTYEKPISIMELRALLSGFLKIPLKHCLGIVSTYRTEGRLSFESLNNDFYTARTKQFEQTLKQISDKELTLSEKSLLLFREFAEPETISQTEKFNFFLKQLTDFETVFEKEKFNPKLQNHILTQLENSIISENPPNSLEVEEDNIIIATAQKIIDLGIKRKHMILLDVTSGEWKKQDLGTLYNAWVFQSSWDGEEFTYEKNLELSEEKTKRQLRKLVLCTENIIAFSSLYDINAVENTGGIEPCFKSKKKENILNFRFTPRSDQAPVLEYNSGKMAISAVPGAGKTTILLALIIKLLQKGVQPEKIFVLTYMESAARTFKERIKKYCPNLESVPNISTIHGLALRILKENSNYTKAGLAVDFEVCDENQRQKTIYEILAKSGIDTDEFDKYEKAVSALKLSCAKKLKKPSTQEAKRFLNFYKNYNLALKKQNVIDYDDMLLLSVRILSQNPDIAAYYQDLCEYVIEDEAQDSSVIQQELISLLSAKHKNVIRCGDINQSITNTFTNADKEGFAGFIKESKSVSMESSQRCNKQIFSLANSLIDYANDSKDFKNAFFKIKMKEVKGQNPDNTNSLEIKTFDEYNDERNYIIEELRKIFALKSSASVAILVRNNFQITEYEQLLANFGFSVITRSDCLDRQPVFNLIYSILKFCAHPWQNENVISLMETLFHQRLLMFSQDDFDYVSELKTPFIMVTTDNFSSVSLTQLAWDLNYWLENSIYSYDELTLKIGNYYYSTDIEKSNIHLISGMLRKLSSLYKNDLIEKLGELSKKPAQYKFFADEEKSDTSEEKTGTVQIMTYHKSKGDEFDYVFIPELSEAVLPMRSEKLKIKSDLRFIEHIKSLNPSYKPKNETELKIFQIEENLRLLYVAFTRAKRGLYITCARKYKKFSRLRDIKPSILFDDFFCDVKQERSAINGK